MKWHNGLLLALLCILELPSRPRAIATVTAINSSGSGSHANSNSNSNSPGWSLSTNTVPGSDSNLSRIPGSSASSSSSSETNNWMPKATQPSAELRATTSDLYELSNDDDNDDVDDDDDETNSTHNSSHNSSHRGSGNITPNANDSYGYYDKEMMCDNIQNPISNLITMILYSLVCIIGLFGNTLVIYVVLRFSKMQTVTNIYILNLAIADECFLIGIPFLLYTMQTGSWKFGEYMCKAYMVSTSITQFTSSIFLLIMSADRYIAVCHPISSPRYRTPLVSKVVSAIAWLTSVLLMLPVILFASSVENNDHISCNIKWPDAQDTQSGTTFILYTLTLGFATPLTFILGFYYLVIRKLHSVGPKHKSKEKKRSHRKVTKLVLTVITVYIMCWLPYWISQVALINSSPSQCASRLEITIFLLVGCLGYSNSAMNPILYAFLSDNFKKSFMKACTCAARKDVNAQLQLENSLFPKLAKNRQSERLLPATNKIKQKALVARNNNAANAKLTVTTTTTTTNTGNSATTLADSGVSGFGGIGGGGGIGGAISSSARTNLRPAVCVGSVVSDNGSAAGAGDSANHQAAVPEHSGANVIATVLVIAGGNAGGTGGGLCSTTGLGGVNATAITTTTTAAAAAAAASTGTSSGTCIGTDKADAHASIDVAVVTTGVGGHGTAASSVLHTDL